MPSKVNYGKYRVNTDGLIFRADGYSSRSYDHNSEYWRDLTPSGIDVKLTDSGLYDSASGYYKFRNPDSAANKYAAVSGSDFTELRSLGAFKDKDSSFSIEAFFEIKVSGADSPPDNGAVIFGNTDANKSGYSYGLLAMTGNGGEISGINAVLASNKIDSSTNHPWTGITGVLSDVDNPSISTEKFYHAAMTYDGSNGKTISYLDGIAKNTGTFPSSQEIHQPIDGTYQQLYVGGNLSSGLNVNIGMVSCYNRALASGEVYGNCQAVKHRYGGGY